MHASGFFADVKSQAQAMVKVLAGAEMGLPAFASMSGIHIVQGKPVIGANLIATLVKMELITVLLIIIAAALGGLAYIEPSERHGPVHVAARIDPIWIYEDKSHG